MWSREDINLASRFLLRRQGEDDDKYQSRMDSCSDDAGADALGRLQAAGFELALNRLGDYVLDGSVATPSSEGGSADSATASNTILPPVINVADNESILATDLNLLDEGEIASLHSLNAKKQQYPPGAVRIVLDKYIDLRSCVVDIADQMLLFEEMKFPVSKEDKKRFFNALFQAETMTTVAG